MSSATRETYELKCKVKSYETWVDDVGGRALRKLCFLVPEENTQCDNFLRAWLPADKSEHFELSGYIKSPISSQSVFSIHRRDERCDRHYLMVMWKGVEEEILEHMKEGAILGVTILPEDVQLDEPDRDSNLDLDVIT